MSFLFTARTWIEYSFVLSTTSSPDQVFENCDSNGHFITISLSQWTHQLIVTNSINTYRVPVIIYVLRTLVWVKHGHFLLGKKHEQFVQWKKPCSEQSTKDTKNIFMFSPYKWINSLWVRISKKGKLSFPFHSIQYLCLTGKEWLALVKTNVKHQSSVTRSFSGTFPTIVAFQLKHQNWGQ